MREKRMKKMQYIDQRPNKEYEPEKAWSGTVCSHAKVRETLGKTTF